MSESKTRHYEVVVIFNPELSDLDPKVADSYRKIIEQGGGQVTRSEDWGRKSFAYRLDNHTKGHYVLINFSSDDSDLVANIQDALDKDDTVLRTLVTRTRREVTEKSPMLLEIEKAEEAAKAEA